VGCDPKKKPARQRATYHRHTEVRKLLGAYDLYNTDRAHTGYRNKGRTPEAVIGKAKMYPRP
jgi:hypothetical protein